MSSCIQFCYWGFMSFWFSFFFYLIYFFLYKYFENFLLVINTLNFTSIYLSVSSFFNLSCLTLSLFNLKFYIFFISKKLSVIIPSNITSRHNSFSHSDSETWDLNHYIIFPLWKESQHFVALFYLDTVSLHHTVKGNSGVLFCLCIPSALVPTVYWMNELSAWRSGGGHRVRARGTVEPGQQSNFMTILCAHTQVHDLCQHGSPFSSYLPVGVNTWGSPPSCALRHWSTVSAWHIHNQLTIWPEAPLWQL